MKLDYSEMPECFSSAKSPIVRGSIKDLDDTGVSTFVGNGIKKGDTVEFPDTEDAIPVNIQEFKSNKFSLIGVKRNNEASWLRTSSLSKMDKNGKYSCELSEQLAHLQRDRERVQFLLGKTIVCEETKPMEVYVFKEGKITNETKIVDFPIIKLK